MSQEVRAMFESFDALKAQCESGDVKLLIEAIAVHASIVNARLAAIESLSAAQMRQAGMANLNPLGARR